MSSEVMGLCGLCCVGGSALENLLSAKRIYQTLRPIIKR